MNSNSNHGLAIACDARSVPSGTVELRVVASRHDVRNSIAAAIAMFARVLLSGERVLLSGEREQD